jgi:dTDP-4-dehydrorhamnose reductase
MKIVVIGSNGQLGSQLVQTLSVKNEVVCMNHDQMEIVDKAGTENLLRGINPDVVINTAAFHNVPVCEKEPLRAFEVNALGAMNLAQLSEKLGFVLVHYSTDYVFDGKKAVPYTENDKTNPLNIYALTKNDGEILIQNNCHRFFIVRISGIYGRVPCRAKGGNFITTMIKAAKERDIVKVVDDEILTPTSVDQIAENTELLIQQDTYGVYHMTCQEFCSWFEFAQVIFEKLKLLTPLMSCKSDEFPSSVKRPMYSVLENMNLQKIAMDRMSHWKNALIDFLDKNYFE